MIPPRRKLPPIWVLGLTNATFGMMGGFSVVTFPAMLATQGVSGGRIAAITSTVLSPGFWIFIASPMLDVRFSRRTYALLFSLLTAASVAYTVIHHTNVGGAEAVMLLGYVSATLTQGAVGGWTGSLIRKEDDSRLGAWFAVANTGAGGVMMLIGAQLVAHLPASAAAGLLAGILMLPCLTYLVIPAPPPDRKLASESFAQFFGDIVALVWRPSVQIALVVFVLPSASFALTNVLGGVGPDFSAGEWLVGMLAGTGSTIAGVVGSLLLPPLAKKLPLRPLYLGVGIVGGAFTLCLLALPHTPTTFAVAITGENAFQALAIAAANAIAFETIGPGNPLAATQFTLLISAMNLPIIYMGFVDARAYTWHGIAGSFLADSSISIAVCAALAWGLLLLRRHGWVSPTT